ncbi:crossover junction endodeoxyribonuclease RuvC [Lysobacter sp. CA199]|uniref:crossover junction endodeoxyribonuclease RuvC n=1 Tax=Lysobacter sp. CA199 TaxID=3455608 RepID=UPI003F8D1C83
MNEIKQLQSEVTGETGVLVPPYVCVRAHTRVSTGKPVTSVTQPVDIDSPLIIALDLGTSLGWAIRLSGQAMSGTEHFKVGRFEGGGMRYLRFVRWLDDLWRFAGPPSTLYFEEVRRHRGVDAAHVYGGFLAQLTAWCERHAVPYQGVPVGTIKKFATGKGNADKAAMIEAAKRLGHEPADDNEADALALLHWAITQEQARV